MFIARNVENTYSRNVTPIRGIREDGDTNYLYDETKGKLLCTDCIE